MTDLPVRVPHLSGHTSLGPSPLAFASFVAPASERAGVLARNFVIVFAMDKGRADYPIASRATQHWHAITTAAGRHMGYMERHGCGCCGRLEEPGGHGTGRW